MIEEGEHNTKYFCSLEKARAKKKIMTHLRKDSGEIISDQKRIMKEQVSFYKNVYSQTTNVIEVEQAASDFMNDINFTCLEDM